jgi:hypothetical protein
MTDEASTATGAVASDIVTCRPLRMQHDEGSINLPCIALLAVTLHLQHEEARNDPRKEMAAIACVTKTPLAILSVEGVGL